MTLFANYFLINQEIGEGSYAKVYVGEVRKPFMNLPLGTKVALKSIYKHKSTSAVDRQNLENEIDVLRRLDHPNIVKLYDALVWKQSHILVMEYCKDGDLLHFLRAHPYGLPESTVRDLTVQIASGLDFLHKQQIVHRDLKPHNILLSDGIAKIADFGFARLLGPDNLANSVVGSPVYMAPEIQFGQAYTSAVDIWSLGIILYEMIVNQTPFPGSKTRMDIVDSLRQSRGRLELPASVTVSPDLRSLIPRLLTLDPNKRMTMEELMAHPFISGIPIIARFSFVATIGMPQTSKDAIVCLHEAIEAAAIINNHLDESHLHGNYVLLQTLTLVAEFLVNFSNEFTSYFESVPELVELNEIAHQFITDAEELSNLCHEPDSQLSAEQFLFDIGVKYAEEAKEEERIGHIDYAAWKYRQAIGLIFPLAFESSANRRTLAIRHLYKGLIELHSGIQQRQN